MPRRFSGPLVPGTKSTRQFNRRVPRRPRRQANLASVTKLMKSVALKQCETKRISLYIEDEPLFHNVTKYIPALLDTVQGVENPGANAPFPLGRIRVGNEIIARGISIKFWLQNAVPHPNLMYRIVVFKYPTLVGPVLSDSRLWQGKDGAGSDMNRMIDTIATNRVKILYSTIIKPTPFTQEQFDGVAKTTLFEKYISLRNMKLKYKEDGGQDPMFQNVGIAIVPYDRFQTAESTQVATLGHTIRTYFKDP